MVVALRSTFLHSSVDGPCPACKRNHDKDCRWTDDLGLVLCWTKAQKGTSTVPEPPDEVETGNQVYRTIGLTDDGKWMQYRLITRRVEKPIRPAGKVYYDYRDRVTCEIICRVTRTDNGNGKKDFSQLYRNPNTKEWERYTKHNGKLVSNFSDQLKAELKSRVLPYRWHDCQKAITDGKPIWVVEGEGKADLLMELGLPAITFIGGSGKYQVYGYPGYLKDLEGATLVLCPDRDQVGLKHMEDVFRDFPDARWLYAEPDSLEWNHPPKNKGLDLADWIQDGATREQILAAVEERRDVAVPPNPGSEELNSPAIDQRIDDLLDGDASPEAVAVELQKLADETAIPFHHLYRLFQERQEARDRQELLRRDSDDLLDVIQHDQPLDLNTILPEPLAKALTMKADAARIDPVHLIQFLLPCVGLLVGARASILIQGGETSDDHWIEHPIFWTMDVAPPSTGKSIAEEAITKPIRRWQKEEDERIKLAKKELRKVRRQWDALSPDEQKAKAETAENPEVYEEEVIGAHRKYLVSNPTSEALFRRISEQQPQSGVGCLVDELFGFFTGLDQHKKGLGNSRQTLLSAWNGVVRDGSERVDAEASIFFDDQTLSLGGGIQPGLMEKLFNLEKDADGLLSRMLIALPKIPDNFDQPYHGTVNLYPVLENLYTCLDHIESCQAVFSNAAKKRFDVLHSKLKRAQVRHLTEGNGAVAALCGKGGKHLARLALGLHLIEWVFDGTGDLDFQEIQVETLERAKVLMYFYVRQLIKLQTYYGASSQDKKPDLQPKIYEYVASKREATVRSLCKRFSREKLTTKQAWEILQAMSRLIEVQGDGAIGDRVIKIRKVEA